MPAAGGNQAEVAPPSVTGTPAVSPAGPDVQWTEGETVEVTLAFSEEVEVDTGGGTPSVGISLGGTEARSATYESGSGTAELVFGYTLAKDDGSHSVMAVTPDSLALMAETADLPAPMVRAAARLHRHRAAWLRSHKVQQLRPAQLLAERNRPVRPRTVQLKAVLRQIDPDHVNLFHGRPLSRLALTTPPTWHIAMPSGGASTPSFAPHPGVAESLPRWRGMRPLELTRFLLRCAYGTGDRWVPKRMG